MTDKEARPFVSPTDLQHNRGPIADPAAFAEDAGAYADVQAAVAESVNLIADPPRPFDMDVARQGVAALDGLPRPTLVTFSRAPRRTTPRSRTRIR